MRFQKEVITEAIVNAIAHRDYTSNASVQVMLFADRFEVWNPGELPPGLTTDQLRHPHASLPRNPLLADPLFLAHYAERAGTGTLDMIARCREANLPEPTFEQRGDQFVTTVWRDWFTDAVISGLGLNERQKQALVFVKGNGRINNTQFQELAGVAKRTAHRDLLELVSKGVFARFGTTGKGTFYAISKGAAKRPKGPPKELAIKGATKGPKGPT